MMTFIVTSGNIDLLQRTIKDNIMTSTLGLFDVVVNELKGKKYIQIIVAKGAERPYYLRGMGMIALIKNNYQKDGSIKIPKVLQPYMYVKDKIKKKLNYIKFFEYI